MSAKEKLYKKLTEKFHRVLFKTLGDRSVTTTVMDGRVYYIDSDGQVVCHHLLNPTLEIDDDCKIILEPDWHIEEVK